MQVFPRARADVTGTAAGGTNGFATSPSASASAGADALLAVAEAAPFEVFVRLESSPKGLTEQQASERLARCGENRPSSTAPASLPRRAVTAARSPFVGLLTCLGGVFLCLGDARGAVTVTVMVALSVGARFWQLSRSERAVAASTNIFATTATVRRRADPEQPPAEREVPLEDVVPGDVLLLGPGDVIPADVRLLAAAGARVDQSSLSGEALPVAKFPPAGDPARPTRQPPGDRAAARHHVNVVEYPSLCFAGTSMVSGTATAVVIATGSTTYVDSLAREVIASRRPETTFDRGVREVGATLVRLMLILVPIVLAINAAMTRDWSRAVTFAVAVAVGLTPEMLPVIVTSNLTRAATRLAARKVIITRLNAIQDLGAADVMCVDKTGTLTEDRVVYAHSIDPDGLPSGLAAEYANLALHFQTDPVSRLDEAIITQLGGPTAEELLIEAFYELTEEIGFDPYRRRASVVLRHTPAIAVDPVSNGGTTTRQDRGTPYVLITKGDPEVVLARCTHGAGAGETDELTSTQRAQITDMIAGHAAHGLRMLAVAVKYLAASPNGYGEDDENDLTLVGFIGFIDPVRAGVAETVRALTRDGVAVKVLTGDDQRVTAHTCEQAGIDVGRIVLGTQVEAATDARLRVMVNHGNVFARLTPVHKARIIAALRETGHTVGFVGDGVNDAPALRLADVGIAPDTATDVAKHAADLILLDKDLGVIAEGIREGRRTLGNTFKYVYITASSNFGNVLSVVVASLMLPFVPMLPIQLMAQNLLYDAAQLALPFDRVNEEFARAPRRWDAAGLVGFMLVFGPLSSLFDVATFAVLWWVLDLGDRPAVFHTAWFVEGLCTQLLAVLVLRAASTVRRSARGSARPARAVLIAAAVTGLIGLVLPISPVAPALGMSPLPATYLWWLLAVLITYGFGLEATKRWYQRGHPRWW
ncbi:MAG TPA: magnesium-translocating P-type ATPase [Pseudonocardia sp.]|jgi:Mg2+-importing ATPase